MTADRIRDFMLEVLPELKTLATQQRIPCRFHDEEKSSMSVNIEKGIFYCFYCGAKGNYVTLIKYFFPTEPVKSILNKYQIGGYND